MRTTYKITDKLLFDRYVFDIDTSKLSSAYLGKRKEFLAEGDLFVWFIGEEDWSFVSGEFSADSFTQYGFELIPETE